MSKFNFNFQKQFANIQSAVANNTGNWAAAKKSLAVLYGILQQQSSLLSHVYVFRFLRADLPGVCGSGFTVQKSRETDRPHRGPLMR